MEVQALQILHGNIKRLTGVLKYFEKVYFVPSAVFNLSSIKYPASRFLLRASVCNCPIPENKRLTYMCSCR